MKRKETKHTHAHFMAISIKTESLKFLHDDFKKNGISERNTHTLNFPW